MQDCKERWHLQIAALISSLGWEWYEDDALVIISEKSNTNQKVITACVNELRCN